jgi:hypothetical protein
VLDLEVGEVDGRGQLLRGAVNTICRRRGEGARRAGGHVMRTGMGGVLCIVIQIRLPNMLFVLLRI